jgi:uncharacterized protein
MKLFFLLVFGLISIVHPQKDVPELKYWANDQTGTLSSEQLNSLNLRLKTFEDTTGTQLVMLMINSLDGYPIENYAIAVAEKNKIGTRENDNGILLLIAKEERELRIEVGYGLEGVVPDALASSIIRNVIIPYFRKDDYYSGISEGLNAIIAASAGEYTAEPNREEPPKGNFFTLLMIIIFIIFFFSRGGRGGGLGRMILLGGLAGSMSGRGGFRGGRSSGGGFGGFSGGGGSFGGGGASGRW